jgi:hypothetical protein
MRKIAKKRLNAFAKVLKSKIAKSEDMSQIMRYFRAMNRATFLLNKHHGPVGFKIEDFKKINLGAVLRHNDLWKDQVRTRKFMIMGHRDFFCPVSKQCLDMDRSFIISDVIFDFKALDKLKPEAIQLIDLGA